MSMRFTNKAKIVNKIMENQPQIQKLKYINWNKITQISHTHNKHPTSFPTNNNHEKNNEKNPTSKYISQLITQNSQLKKQIYHLDHQIAVIKLDFQNKQLQYKNTIRQYKKMINSLLHKIGYHVIENGQVSQEEVSGRSSSNWQNNRGHLYAKYIDEQVYEEQVSDDLSYQSHVTSRSNSKRNSQSLECSSEKNVNPQNSCEQEQLFNGQISKQFQRKHFVLQPTEYLNFNLRSLQKSENKIEFKDHLQSFSSITDMLRPVSQQIPKQSQIQTKKNIQISPSTTKSEQKPKAQTQRIQKIPQPQISQNIIRTTTQIIYQNQSFKKIIQNGSKNRQRINQLLKNKIK